MTVVIQIRNR